MAVDLDRKQKMYSIPGAGVEAAFTKFTLNDLIGNIFYFNHKLECKYPIVAVYDNSDKQIGPTEVVPIDENRLQIDLTGVMPLAGETFKVRAIGG